ncbi:MAG: glutamine-hydrolyzing carbamoyl-phosphate synthase small subunit [Candidatus Rokubacteria bacterium]|nr:glutamine-hydrolyzing carbamoyl-phosphate synthase small subunit [Candidatus Rokubacteria bacterium]MBI4629755.1 glutamine-hydrolyzing carbamoyl-phosphate synthase small subunit [Candidatus Rokubacteria bacterium]
MRPALLVLRDGRIFRGQALGAIGEASGEVIFNTAMSGYQEILTDPSYKGQIVAMTYPLIGNYGVNEEDVESRRPWVNGFIVKEASSIASSFRSATTLDAYLKAHGIVGIQGIDTRALTRHLRDHGAQDGIVSSVAAGPADLVARVRDVPGLVGRDLVAEVTAEAPYTWAQGGWERARGYVAPPPPRCTVVAYDCGIKWNILRQLRMAGCDVTVVPASTPAAAVLELKPDGLFLSNGPGDPEGVPYLIGAVRALLGRVPIFGICLGHQILGLAGGGRTYKLPFGHHGANHPVKDLATGKVAITAQNHGFAVDPDSAERHGWTVTHVNLNDGTCEGLRHREWPAFSVQYHPEASPGPHDANYLFHRFTDLMARKGG